jgi:hypothetical protein
VLLIDSATRESHAGAIVIGEAAFVYDNENG